MDCLVGLAMVVQIDNLSNKQPSLANNSAGMEQPTLQFGYHDGLVKLIPSHLNGSLEIWVSSSRSRRTCYSQFEHQVNHFFQILQLRVLETDDFTDS